jgi:alpha-L-fucosidase
MLGWDKGQKEITLASLATKNIDLKNLKSVALIDGAAGKYLPLEYRQDEEGLTVSLPQRPDEELAYVIKLTFRREIPALLTTLK